MSASVSKGGLLQKKLPLGKMLVGAVGLMIIFNFVAQVRKTPEQLAMEHAEFEKREQRSRHKDLIENAEEVLQQYIKAPHGTCESLGNASLDNLRYGKAVFQGATMQPTITGSYSVDCVVHLMGENNTTRQTYWFRITMDKKSGQREGDILLDNPQGINRGLSAFKFQQE